MGDLNLTLLMIQDWAWLVVSGFTQARWLLQDGLTHLRDTRDGDGKSPQGHSGIF